MGKCRATKDGHVSKRRELVHDDFMGLLSKIKPDEPTQKLFREIVLKRWNNEFKGAAEHNARLNREAEALDERKSRIIDLYIDGRLTDADKTTKLAEIDREVVRIKIQTIEADKYADQKEAIIDGALLFMSDAGLFWNLGDIDVKRRVQDTIFPDGVNYDFDSGFEPPKLAKSYLLMKQISEAKNENSSLVATGGFEPPTPGL